MKPNKKLILFLAVILNSHLLISEVKASINRDPNSLLKTNSVSSQEDKEQHFFLSQPRQVHQTSEITSFHVNDNPITDQESQLNPNLPTGWLAQTPSVFQLKDVEPSDWAFQAVQNLVERYNCLSGYPGQTFRGDRALTRYEFAAALNSCLEQLIQLNAESEGNVLDQAELNTLQRLQTDFATELEAINTQVDNLEARTDALEDNRFSPTTKLFGNLRVQANTHFSGEGQGGEEPNSTLQYNLYLGFLSSFTGKDLLVTGIGVTQTPFFEFSPTNAENPVGGTREGASDTTGSGDTDSDARLITLQYQFPVGEKLLVNLIAANRFRFDPVLLPQFVPYYRLGNGPVSSFAEAPPIYLVGGGSGVSASYELLDSTVLSLTYLATFANFAGQVAPNVGGGLFGGDYVASAQINYNPSPNLFLQALYQRGYFQAGNFAFNNGQFFRGNGFVGTALANRFDNAGVFFDEDSEVLSDSYLLGGYFALSPQVFIGGWANLYQMQLPDRGDATIWTYSVQAAFPNLFKEGNQGGLVIGMEPTLTSIDPEEGVSCTFCNEFEKDTSLHIEAYYRHQLTEQLSITPSIIWITAPNQDADNEDIVIGGLRTTFNF